jgi:cytochrome c oxidase subunit I+III
VSNLALITQSHTLAERDPDRHNRLRETWKGRPGFWGWFTWSHHKEIGIRYLVTAFCFLLLGGILALVMRLQLARPENHLLGPDKYNQFFTMHGTTMMFLFAVPVMFEALATYFVPLMIGARNVAFPRLASFSYFLYLFGGIVLWAMFLLNAGADAGWFSYVPLSGPAFTPGHRADGWSVMVMMTEISAVCVAVEILVTVFKLRAPGMSLNRIPLFVWVETIVAFSVIFALPAVILSSLMLFLDRNFGTQFFNPAEGGDALLYQHLFWFFGHPEVYIVFLPGAGVISTLVATFCRRRTFGYLAIVLSTVSIGFLGFGVWVHHMFATGLPMLSLSFFTAASLMIVIPTGIQIFCWLATIITGKLWLATPMLWVFGFFFIFILGGLTGVMLASVPLDLQAHDTYFVVAHLHYVVVGGAVFPLFGAVEYWFPKITGRMLNEVLSNIFFWLFFVGFNLTFFPMHLVGLAGMTRRIYTYGVDRGWGEVNGIETVGAFIMGLGVLFFVINLIRSARRGRIAGDNPWQAGTLEWATSSPPPAYNFLYIPVVQGRETVWEDEAHPERAGVVKGLRDEAREMLVTTVVDAYPDHRLLLPAPSIWPFWAAVVVCGTAICTVFEPWAFVVGALLFGIVLIGWFWPSEDETAAHHEGEKWDNATA